MQSETPTTINSEEPELLAQGSSDYTMRRRLFFLSTLLSQAARSNIHNQIRNVDISGTDIDFTECDVIGRILLILKDECQLCKKAVAVRHETGKSDARILYNITPSVSNRAAAIVNAAINVEAGFIAAIGSLDAISNRYSLQCVRAIRLFVIPSNEPERLWRVHVVHDSDRTVCLIIDQGSNSIGRGYDISLVLRCRTLKIHRSPIVANKPL